MTQFLSQFSIRLKIFSLIVVGAAAAFIIGLNGILGASSMFELTTDMHKNMLQPVRWLGQAAKQAAYVSRSDYRYIAETEKPEMDQVAATRDAQEAEVRRYLDMYRKTELTPPEVDGLRRFDAAWAAMEVPCKQMRDLSRCRLGGDGGAVQADARSQLRRHRQRREQQEGAGHHGQAMPAAVPDCRRRVDRTVKNQH
ncbi:MCP four helix bundle domain-containing protein [Chromobacterium piscinae]|uniref:MCP four helix bundle domain-containing protein n=1 Tax=Chromobacterium piscinae TaxID=686831 RepID=UPI0031FC0708